MSDSEYMTKRDVVNYVKRYTSELVWAAVAGVLIGIGLITLIGDLTDLGVAETFAWSNLLGWGLLILAGILAAIAMLHNRRKRIALE
jgi:hypothetical protein